MFIILIGTFNSSTIDEDKKVSKFKVTKMNQDNNIEQNDMFSFDSQQWYAFWQKIVMLQMLHRRWVKRNHLLFSIYCNIVIT